MNFKKCSLIRISFSIHMKILLRSRTLRPLNPMISSRRVLWYMIYTSLQVLIVVQDKVLRENEASGDHVHSRQKQGWSEQGLEQERVRGELSEM